MDLRLFLFERRLKQTQIVRAAQTKGHGLYPADVCRFVSGQRRPDWVKTAIRGALLELGFTKIDLGKIEDLN